MCIRDSLASVVGAFYYLRLIKTIWFDEQNRQFVKPVAALSVLSALSALVLFAVLFLPVLRAPVQAVLGAAANSLF